MPILTKLFLLTTGKGFFFWTATIALLLPVTPAAQTGITLSGPTLTCRIESPPGEPLPLSKNSIPPRALTRSAIQRYLDSLGFFDRRIHEPHPDHLVIHTGLRARVCGIRIQGGDEPAARDILPLRFPRPYNAGEISTSVSALLQRRASRGHPFAVVTTTLLPCTSGTQPSDSSRRALMILLSVEPGPACVFGNPILTGDFSTKKDVILRDIRWKHGSRFDIRKIDNSRIRLNSRSYISSVTPLSPRIVQIDTSDSGITAEVAIPLRIEDRSGLNLDGAVGFSTTGDGVSHLSGKASLALLNILHRGESLRLSYQGDRGYQRLNADFGMPLHLHRPLTLTGNAGIEVEEGSHGFSQAGVGMSTELRPLWEAGLKLSVHEAVDTSGAATRFGGIGFSITRKEGGYRPGHIGGQLSLETTSGLAYRLGATYPRLSFEPGAGVHLPIRGRYALWLYAGGKSLYTEQQDLITAELYRIGGQGSVRGYADREFAFRSVVHAQVELLAYLGREGAVYLFADPALGFRKGIPGDVADRKQMLGYGIGVRAPTRLGSFALEWARSIEDVRGLGRIHFGFRTP